MAEKKTNRYDVALGVVGSVIAICVALVTMTQGSTKASTPKEHSHLALEKEVSELKSSLKTNMVYIRLELSDIKSRIK